ncbi:MAG: PilZ domain-containing protein [Spirochaetia bacterium]|nr:PilZ domain-containing protein [Spirochaetia bacterium]
MKKERRESRKHPRYTKIIQMECEVERFPDDLSGEKAKLKSGDTFRATTINVSETGMLINYDFLLPERTIIKISVNDRAFPKKIEFLARITWTKRNAYKIFGRFAAGLQYEDADSDDIMKLVEHFA